MKKYIAKALNEILREITVLLIIVVIATGTYLVASVYKDLNNSIILDTINLNTKNMSERSIYALNIFNKSGYNFVEHSTENNSKVILGYNPKLRIFREFDLTHLSENEFRNLYIHLYYMKENPILSEKEVNSITLTISLSLYIIIQLYRLGYHSYIYIRKKQIEQTLEV